VSTAEGFVTRKIMTLPEHVRQDESVQVRLTAMMEKAVYDQQELAAAHRGLIVHPVNPRVEGEGFFVDEEVPAGCDLESRRTGAPLHWRTVAQLGVRLCETLLLAQRTLPLGPHGGIRPRCIYLTDPEQAQVLIGDFGITAAIASELNLRAVSHELDHVAPYFAPELQSPAGGACTEGTDIFALGVVLYELLTGRHPYRIGAAQRDNPRRCMQCLVVNFNDRLAGSDVDAPSELAEAIDKAVGKSPLERHPDLASFQAMLKTVAGELPPVIAPPTAEERARAEAEAREAERLRQEEAERQAAEQKRLEEERRAEEERRRIEADKRAEAERRQEEERKRLEEERRAEEERLRQEQEKRKEAERLAEEQRRKEEAEQRRVEEERRLEEEQRAEEERRQAEEQRRREAEERRKAEEQRRRDEEQRRKEEERLAEERRQAELKRQEEARKAEEARQAEAARLKAEAEAKAAAEHAAMLAQRQQQVDLLSNTLKERIAREFAASGVDETFNGATAEVAFEPPQEQALLPSEGPLNAAIHITLPSGRKLDPIRYTGKFRLAEDRVAFHVPECEDWSASVVHRLSRRQQVALNQALEPVQGFCPAAEFRGAKWEEGQLKSRLKGKISLLGDESPAGLVGVELNWDAGSEHWQIAGGEAIAVAACKLAEEQLRAGLPGKLRTQSAVVEQQAERLSLSGIELQNAPADLPLRAVSFVARFEAQASNGLPAVSLPAIEGQLERLSSPPAEDAVSIERGTLRAFERALKPPGKTPVGLWMGIGAAALIVLGVGGYLMIPGGGDQPNGSDDPPRVEQPDDPPRQTGETKPGQTDSTDNGQTTITTDDPDDDSSGTPDRPIDQDTGTQNQTQNQDRDDQVATTDDDDRPQDDDSVEPPVTDPVVIETPEIIEPQFTFIDWPLPPVELDEQDAGQANGQIKYRLRIEPAVQADLVLSIIVSDPNRVSLSSNTVKIRAGQNQSEQITLNVIHDEIDHGRDAASVRVTHSVDWDSDAAANTDLPTEPLVQSITIKEMDRAGVALLAGDGQPVSRIDLSEPGAGDSYSVVLSSRPRRAVTVEISSISDAVVIQPENLSFDASSWSTPQSVQVNALKGIALESEARTIEAMVAHALASDDSEYASLAVDDIAISIAVPAAPEQPQTGTLTPGELLAQLRAANSADQFVKIWDDFRASFPDAEQGQALPLELTLRLGSQNVTFLRIRSGEQWIYAGTTPVSYGDLTEAVAAMRLREWRDLLIALSETGAAPELIRSIAGAGERLSYLSDDDRSASEAGGILLKGNAKVPLFPPLPGPADRPDIDDWFDSYPALITPAGSAVQLDSQSLVRPVLRL
jgi:hypothetical protein